MLVSMHSMKTKLTQNLLKWIFNTWTHSVTVLKDKFRSMILIRICIHTGIFRYIMKIRIANVKLTTNFISNC